MMQTPLQKKKKKKVKETRNPIKRAILKRFGASREHRVALIAAFCSAIKLAYRDTPRLPIIAVQLNACTLGPWLDNREERAV